MPEEKKEQQKNQSDAGQNGPVEKIKQEEAEGEEEQQEEEQSPNEENGSNESATENGPSSPNETAADAEEEEGNENEQASSSNNNNGPVLSDVKDYRSIRSMAEIKDPMELYYRAGYTPSEVYNNPNPKAQKPSTFYMLSPKMDGNNKPVDRVQYIVGVNISPDEVAQIRNDFEERMGVIRKQSIETRGFRDVGSSTNNNNGNLRGAALASHEAKVAAGAATGSAGTSVSALVPSAATAVTGTTTPTPTAAAAASEPKGQKALVEQLVKTLKELNPESISPELEKSVLKAAGIGEEMSEKDLENPHVLAWAKADKDRAYIAHLLQRNKNLDQIMGDVGLQALLVCFQLAQMDPDETRNTILSFNNPTELIAFVNEKLSDAFAAMKDPDFQKMEELRDECIGWHREAEIRKTALDRTTAEYQIAETLHKVAIHCLPGDKFQQYLILESLVKAGRIAEVWDILQERQRKMAAGYPDPGFGLTPMGSGPGPGGGGQQQQNGYAMVAVPNGHNGNSSPASSPLAAVGHTVSAASQEARQKAFLQDAQAAATQILREKYPDLDPEIVAARQADYERRQRAAANAPRPGEFPWTRQQAGAAATGGGNQ